MSGHDKEKTDQNIHNEPDRHADHIAGKHRSYDPDCEDCRRQAEQEYRGKLESGELNNIEFKD